MIKRGGYIAVLLLALVALGIWAIVSSSSGGLSGDILSRADSMLAPPSSYGVSYANNSVKGDYSKSGRYTTKRRYKTLSIELNSADSAKLRRVYGIGPVFSRRIVEYRVKLGGYYSVAQLNEIKGIDSEVYERIFRNFFVDSTLISKININFATQNELSEHPYITSSMAKRVVKAKMKGGYISSPEELLNKNILLPAEALRVSRYFDYRDVVNGGERP